MSNFLKGLQYRERKHELPTFHDEGFTAWKDVTDETTFHTGTQFRLAPAYVYVVTDSTDVVVDSYDTKTAAMSKVASMVDTDLFAVIRREEKTSPGISTWLGDNNIQYKLVGHNSWSHGQYFAPSTTANGRVKFRVRPDHFFDVTVQTGIAQSTITFDDVDEVDEYVSRQLRTSQNTISINRRAYGITHL